MFNGTGDTGNIDAATCPETLLFDLGRLTQYKQEVKEATTLAAILVTFGQAAASFKSDAGGLTYLQNVAAKIVAQSDIDVSESGVEKIARGIEDAMLLINMPEETRKRLYTNIIAATKPGLYFCIHFICKWFLHFIYLVPIVS